MTETSRNRSAASLPPRRAILPPRRISAPSSASSASSSEATRRAEAVLLPNGDDVGVVVPWHMPEAFDGVTAAHVQAVRELARGGQYRADPRSPEWIGGAVADVLSLDVESDADRKRIKSILKEWYQKGVLKKAEDRDPEARKKFVYVEPGEWSEA